MIMRNIITVFLFVFVYTVNAQQIVPFEQMVNYNAYQSNGKYFKDVNGTLNKFLGNWKYENLDSSPTEIVEVTFYKREMVSAGGYFEDELYAHFKYIKNGVEIYNTYITNRTLDIFGGLFIQSDNSNKLRLQYDEPDRVESIKRKHIFYIEYFTENTGGMGLGLSTVAKLNWVLDWWPIAEGAVPPQMPLTMVLTKVSP
jgi:hypothetical protein